MDTRSSHNKRTVLRVGLVLVPTIPTILFVCTFCLWGWFLVDPPILYDPTPIYPGARRTYKENDPLSGWCSRGYHVTTEYKKVLDWYDVRLKAKNPNWPGDWYEQNNRCKFTTIYLTYLVLVDKEVFVEVCEAKDSASDTEIHTGVWYSK